MTMLTSRGLRIVQNKAQRLGIKGRLEISNRKNKRFKITRPDGNVIHFGVYPFKGKGTFIDHKNPDIRNAWMARHSKIMKNGLPAYLNPNSPEYYSWNLLWT